MASSSFEWSSFSSLGRRKLRQRAAKLGGGKMADLPWGSRNESLKTFIPSRLFTRSHDEKVEQGLRGVEPFYDSGLGESDSELSDCWSTGPSSDQAREREAKTRARRAHLLLELL